MNGAEITSAQYPISPACSSHPSRLRRQITRAGGDYSTSIIPIFILSNEDELNHLATDTL